MSVMTVFDFSERFEMDEKITPAVEAEIIEAKNPRANPRDIYAERMRIAEEYGMEEEMI